MSSMRIQSPAISLRRLSASDPHCPCSKSLRSVQIWSYKHQPAKALGFCAFVN